MEMVAATGGLQNTAAKDAHNDSLSAAAGLNTVNVDNHDGNKKDIANNVEYTKVYPKCSL